MNYKRLFALILYIGIALQSAWPAFAEELPGSMESLDVTAPLQIEVPEVASSTDSEDTEIGLFNASEEEPELIWGCTPVIHHDPETGEESEGEECGMGYWRTLCYVAEGEEICETFFEIYIEEEPVDYLAQEIDEMRAYESMSLSLTWNGVPIEDSIPSGSGTLGWSYTLDPEADPELTYEHRGSFEEMFAATDLNLSIYRGPTGSAALITSIPVSHAATGTIPLALSAPGDYTVLLSANFALETEIPGYVCGGEVCSMFRARIESLIWFMEHGADYFADEPTIPREAGMFYEYGERFHRMGTHKPLAFGQASFSVESGPAVSSVLFLPGIKGSRLYRPSDTCDPDLSLSCPGVKVWDPTSNMLLDDLFLTESGTSYRRDVYVKESDILTTALGHHFYASFENQMNALVADGTLPAWKAIAYDWRLSLDDIVNKGVKRDDRIYFSEATENPYIEGTLREMAAASPTGKVSIIAHSNGGLVTKRLMQKLEAEGAADLVDKIILVGVPQSGSPQAMAGLLYGYGEALPFDHCATFPIIGNLCSSLASRATARELAERSPMAYHLLPSQRYFDQIQDPAHPVAKFSATTQYLEERTRYGASVDSVNELHEFLQAADGGRIKPASSDIGNANVLNTSLLSYGRSVHESVDAWVPPAGIEMYQVAGWGRPTISGVEFYEERKFLGGTKEMYRPMFVEDGDSVVPVPSAFMLSSSLENVKNYWIDLEEARVRYEKRYDHGTIFELPNTRILIRNLLLGDTTPVEVTSQSQPDSLSDQKLLFFLHSPLSLELYDSNGRHTGETPDGEFENEIPGVEYGVFGEVQYLIAPPDAYEVKLNGKASGSFSLDVQHMSGNEVTSFVTFSDIPTTAETVVTMDVTGDLSEAGALEIDTNGDGAVDAMIEPALDATVTLPQVTSDSNEARRRGNTVAKISEPVVMPEAVRGNTPTPAEAILTYTDMTLTSSQTKDVLPQENLGVGAEENERRSSLTASVFDSVGASLINWVAKVLYNFWQGINRFITSLFV